MIQILATVYLNRVKWKVSFERQDQEGYLIASFIFDEEPSDPQVHKFLLEHYHLLKFGPKKPFELKNRWSA